MFEDSVDTEIGLSIPAFLANYSRAAAALFSLALEDTGIDMESKAVSPFSNHWLCPGKYL